MFEGLSLPQGYTTRTPGQADAAGIAALITAAQSAYGDDEVVSADDVLSDWDGLDLANDSLMVMTADGELAAYVDIDNRGNVIIAVYGYVHPQHQGRGLGATLVRWGEAWALAHIDAAPAGVRVLTQQYIPVLNSRGRALLEGLAYQSVRTVYVMKIELDGAPNTPDEMVDVVLRDYVPGQDDVATYSMMEEAFGDHWGSVPRTFDDWMEATQSDRAVSGYWHIAEHRASGELVGACLGRGAGGTGWIRGVGVRHDWRRKGIAYALLMRAFATYAQRGIREVSLSVDSESSTGAPHLYTRAGMHVAKSYLVYRKTLREGAEPAVDAGV